MFASIVRGEARVRRLRVMGARPASYLAVLAGRAGATRTRIRDAHDPDPRRTPGLVKSLGYLVGSLLVAGAMLTAWTARAENESPYALSDRDHALFQEVVEALQRTKWKRALTLARNAEDPLVYTIAAWRWLSAEDGLATWEQARDFHRAHADWPLARLRQVLAERRIPANLPDREIVEWFDRFPPRTGLGRARYAEARAASGAAIDLGAEIRDTWRTATFQRAEERAFLQRHGNSLTANDHAARLDRLIWERNWGAAERQLRRVSPDIERLGAARIRLGRRGRGVDAAVARVSAELKSHPGLIYERARWRRRAGLYERAVDLLLDPPPDLGPRPDRWWREVRIHVRTLLDDRRYADAYRLVSGYTALDGSAGAEADWMAGWLANRFLDNPRGAAWHFEDMRDGVSMPISAARASYWAALSKTDGPDGDAGNWLAAAAGYPATFYGQMAARCRGYPIALPAGPAVPADAVAAWEGLPRVRAMLLLADAGQTYHARLFARKLTESAASPQAVSGLYRVVHEAGHTHLGMEVLRRATRAGHYLPDLAFPADVHADAFASVRVDVEPALVLAVARQESGFHLAAHSSAGARGLLQILPSTARQVARQAGIPYELQRLTRDAAYNVDLGSRYLKGLLANFGESYPLALAAYNAGPTRVKRWLRRYGDPLQGDIAMLDWMELIPISETRNYVQRVLEGLAVYRTLLGQNDGPVWEMPLTCPS